MGDQAEILYDVLREHLSESEARRLDDLTQNWQAHPFSFCKESREFEMTENWALLHMDEEADENIDLLIKCCEILTQYQANLDVSKFVDEHPSAGEFTLKFHFSNDPVLAAEPPDNVDVGEQFAKLLRKSPAYQVLEGHYAAGLTVAVRFEFGSDLEFSRQKDHVFWLLEAARRMDTGHPFQGSRL